MAVTWARTNQWVPGKEEQWALLGPHSSSPCLSHDTLAVSQRPCILGRAGLSNSSEVGHLG